jgi:hypothetical protein
MFVVGAFVSKVAVVLIRFFRMNTKTKVLTAYEGNTFLLVCNQTEMLITNDNYKVSERQTFIDNETSVN